MTMDRERECPDDQDRNVIDRAVDEVRSWVGDERAEQRRQCDDAMADTRSPDERLRDAVAERLAEGGVNTRDVVVRVVDRDVVLQGSVPSGQERERAERLACAVPGVGCVADELELRAGELEPGPHVPFPDDPDTRAA